MSIPDYIISRAVLDEVIQRQFRDTPDHDLPEPRRRNEGERFATTRQRLSATLHAIADRIDRQPADPAPSHPAGSTT